MSIQGLDTKIKNHSEALFTRFDNIINGVNLELSNQQTSHILVTASYCLKNEQLLNAFLKQAKLKYEDINLELIKHSIVVASRLSILSGEVSEFSTFFDADIQLNISTKNFDKIEYIMGVYTASNIFYAPIVAGHCARSLEKQGVSKTVIDNILEITSVVRAIHEIIKIDSVRTYEFIARQENF